MDILSSIPKSDEEGSVAAAPAKAVKQSYARWETVREVRGEIWACWANSEAEACGASAVSMVPRNLVLKDYMGRDCPGNKPIYTVIY